MHGGGRGTTISAILKFQSTNFELRPHGGWLDGWGVKNVQNTGKKFASLAAIAFAADAAADTGVGGRKKAIFCT